MGLNEVAENIDNIYPFEYYPPASHEYNPFIIILLIRRHKNTM